MFVLNRERQFRSESRSNRNRKAIASLILKLFESGPGRRLDDVIDWHLSGFAIQVKRTSYLFSMRTLSGRCLLLWVRYVNEIVLFLTRVKRPWSILFRHRIRFLWSKKTSQWAYYLLKANEIIINYTQNKIGLTPSAGNTGFGRSFESRKLIISTLLSLFI